MINTKNFDSNLLKINKKQYKNIYIYYIGYITNKDTDNVNIHSVNSLYLIFDKVDGYIKESNGNKYLNFTSTDKNKEVLGKCTELWDKIKNLIKTINDKSVDFDEKYTKIKLNSDDNLPLNKILKLHNLTIVVRSIFQRKKSIIHKFSQMSVCMNYKS